MCSFAAARRSAPRGPDPASNLTQRHDECDRIWTSAPGDRGHFPCLPDARLRYEYVASTHYRAARQSQLIPLSPMDLFSACAVETVFPDPLPGDPLPLLAQWLNEAQSAAAAPNPDAMVLATVDPGGEPAARVVLCKALDTQSGFLVFYTNYDSRKANDILMHPRAAATFHWDHAGRQARISGMVSRSPKEESDAYFATRPLLSQLAAWASRQSEPVATREAILLQVAAVMEEFGIDIEQVMRGESTRPIPRPPNWGGYRLWIRMIELWSGGAGRLHERVRWTRQIQDGQHLDQGAQPLCFGPWQASRLQP